MGRGGGGGESLSRRGRVAATRPGGHAMRTFRFGGKRIFRRYRSRQLAKCEKIKIVALQRRENAQPGAAQVAAREGAPPRPSWAGAPLAHDAKGNGGCCRREGRHLCAVASHIERIAHSNCRARWNQQVPQRPPIVGWAVCLSGISARLDQASKLASSPPSTRRRATRTKPHKNNVLHRRISARRIL